MSEVERAHWNFRYSHNGWITEPAAFLLEVAPHFAEGSRILDVGGGSGRNAIWLARKGHDLTIADISDVGLQLARDAASEADVEVTTLQVDFDTDPMPPGPWDVLINFHFINRSLFPAFLEVLRPGGFLVFSRATLQNLERHERPPSPYLLEVGEGWDLLDGWDLVVAREGWSIEDRHEFEALARKPW